MRRLLPLLLLAVSALVLILLGPALPADDPARPAMIAALALPGLLWAPGLAWIRREDNMLWVALDAAWLGLALTWVDVGLVRELGLRGGGAAWGQWGLALAWTVGGLIRRPGVWRLPGKRERLGIFAVFGAVLALSAWRATDLARPLDGYWYRTGADEPAQEALPVIGGEGWSSVEALGWEESGALRLIPDRADPSLRATGPAHGRVTIAVRGPLGSKISAGDQENVVAAAMTESEEEGPVARYLRRGVAAITIPVDLLSGEILPLHLDDGAGGHAVTVYLMPGTDAVWSLHSAGALRYVHYYQLLNQQENQVWAEELLSTRRFTLNQPPGWSPILAVATLWVAPDLKGANTLFLFVLLLVGGCAVALLSTLAPGAPTSAWLLPGAFVAAHGLLMIEPGSTNFPDSLYAASLLYAAAALFSGRSGLFAAMAGGAGLLRYPGLVVCAFLLVGWRLAGGLGGAALRRFLLAVGLLGVGTLIAGALGQLPDFLFVLWFEIFPEHWHDDYALSSLLPRVPEFYGLWLYYSGGAVLLALPWLLGPSSPGRRGLRAMALAMGAYSAILATVDHFPTHYFLPLVAFSGVMLGVASALEPPRPLPAVLSRLLPLLSLGGLGYLLWRGEV